MEGFQWISENQHIAFQKSLRFRHWSHVVTEKKQSPDIRISSSYIPRQHTTVTSLCIFQRCLNSNNHIWYTSSIWSILISYLFRLYIICNIAIYNIQNSHLISHCILLKVDPSLEKKLVRAWELVPQQRLPGPTGCPGVSTGKMGGPTPYPYTCWNKFVNLLTTQIALLHFVTLTGCSSRCS